MKNKWKIALIVLVVLNITMLSVLWVKRIERPARPDLDRQGQGREHPIISRLGFDESQKKQFELSLKSHFKVIRPIEDEMHQVRTRLFTSASDDLDQEELASLLDQLSTLQRTADSVMYVHFHQINEICRDDQKEDFKKLLNRMVGQVKGRGGSRNFPNDRPGGMN